MDKFEYLKNAIAQTGYPLEIQLSSMLDKCWDHVINTESYFDREGNKLRDVDIVTSQEYSFTTKEPDMTLRMQTGMVIECKKNPNFAWVFFTRPFRFSYSEIEGHYLDKIQCITKNCDKSDLSELLSNEKPLHYSEFDRVSVAYSEILLKPNASNKNPKGIFEAQNQVKKFMDAQFEQLIVSSNVNSPIVYFFFPCLVFDGEMYEAIVNGENLELREANHMLLSTTYKSPFSVFERVILIDIIRKDYFKNYSEIIIKDRDNLQKYFRVSGDQIEFRCEEIMEFLPSK